MIIYHYSPINELFWDYCLIFGSDVYVSEI